MLFVDLVCSYCGNPFKKKDNLFKIATGRGQSNHYCSKDCVTLSQRKQVQKICTNCNKEFIMKRSETTKSKSGNNFCSKSCAAQYNNKNRARTIDTRKECPICGGPKHTQSITCLICSTNEWLARTISEVSSTSIRSIARSVYGKLGNRHCENCGYDSHIDVAHIKAIAIFDNAATMAEVNEIHNLVGLCRNCHWEFDHDMLSIKLIEASAHYIIK